MKSSTATNHHSQQSYFLWHKLSHDQGLCCAGWNGCSGELHRCGQYPMDLPRLPLSINDSYYAKNTKNLNPTGMFSLIILFWPTPGLTSDPPPGLTSDPLGLPIPGLTSDHPLKSTFDLLPLPWDWPMTFPRDWPNPRLTSDPKGLTYPEIDLWP